MSLPHDPRAYRSGLESRIAEDLRGRGVAADYEAYKLRYVKPARTSRYTPDFILPNGIVIETKGRFLTEDRQKHVLIQDQYPDLDVRFVFSNARARISKTSRTTYAAWCESHGFAYAHRDLPSEWIEELPLIPRIRAAQAALDWEPPLCLPRPDQSPKDSSE